MSTYKGYKNITRILIRCGVDPSKRESFKGFNAIHMCVSNNDEESLIMICSANHTNLYEAITAKNRQGESPIMMAAASGYKKIAGLLEDQIIQELQKIIQELRLHTPLRENKFEDKLADAPPVIPVNNSPITIPKAQSFTPHPSTNQSSSSSTKSSSSSSTLSLASS